MFVRNGAVTPGPSRECDITFFVKGRPKSARQSCDSTVAARRPQSVTVPSSRLCHANVVPPRVKGPPSPKKMPDLRVSSRPFGASKLGSQSLEDILFPPRASKGLRAHSWYHFLLVFGKGSTIVPIITTLHHVYFQN